MWIAFLLCAVFAWLTKRAVAWTNTQGDDFGCVIVPAATLVCAVICGIVGLCIWLF